MSLASQYLFVLEEEAEKIVNEIYGTMIAEAPVYTGKVKGSITIIRTGKFTWFIGPHTDHDYYAEYGNNKKGAYIYPKDAKALHFYTLDGVEHFASKVRSHKGSRFVKKTADKFR